MLDLHTHSTFSDGTFTPAGLVREAKLAGVTRLALTDHDGIGGLLEAREAAEREGVVFLGGLEISAEFQPGTMHILGYGFREDNAALNGRLSYARDSREERNPKIVERLNGLGMSLTMDEVSAKAGGKVVGRPHFAAVLLEKGFVQNRQEAFDLYLAKGKVAYVDKVRLSPAESIAAIRGAGGVAVLAHPLQLKAADEARLEQIVKGLADLGLQGLECHYRNHTEEDDAKFTALARKYGLLMTGGSDFHGANRPAVNLGTGEGRLRVPEEWWEALVGETR